MSSLSGKAESLAHDAEMWGGVEDADIAAQNAQTYALLTVASEIRQLRESLIIDVAKVAAEEVMRSFEQAASQVVKP